MKKLRKQAKELFQAAAKVYNYRRDVLPENRIDELEKAVKEADSFYKRNEPSDEAAFAASLKRLDALLVKIGGKIYPKTFWNDNIEVALVAAIIVIGVRTFFFQPFIIPTNSMYPTYNGMTTKIYEAADAEPSSTEKIFRMITLGARHKSLVPEASGEVKLLLFRDQSGRASLSRKVRGGLNRNGLLPTLKDEYVFLIGGQAQSIVVPHSFDMPSLIKDALGQSLTQTGIVNEPASEIGGAILLNKPAVAGEPYLRFDINIGDALFVDRISYHFVRPKVGDPFVFRTDPILDAVGQATNDYTPKYYIKRLAGEEGETLEIVDGELLVDGQLRDEVEPFVRNANREGEYGGYVNHLLMSEGRSMTIPDNSFIALGDNSANSADSRYWGFVPDKSVIGKAIFIYYPFTKRWGLAE